MRRVMTCGTPVGMEFASIGLNRCEQSVDVFAAAQTMDAIAEEAEEAFSFAAP